MVDEATKTGVGNTSPQVRFHIALDLPVTELPVEETKSGLMARIPFTIHPETMFSLTQSATSVAGAVFRDAWSENLRPVETTMQLLISGAAALASHENAHMYIYTENDLIYFYLTKTFSKALVDLAGTNANLIAAERVPLEPFEGSVTASNEIAAAMDLPVNYFIQNRLGATLSGTPADSRKIVEYYEDRGLGESELAVALLAAWQSADLFLGKDAPFIQLIRYAFMDEDIENPYRPGEFVLKTTGTLSPYGPMYGLMGYLFLEGRGKMPSAVTAKVSACPIRHDESLFPVELDVGAERISVPVSLGPFALALSGGLSFAVYDNRAFIDDTTLDHDIAMIATRGAIHFKTNWGELFTEVRYKQKGFVPDEVLDEDFSVWVGVRYIKEMAGQ